MTNYISTRLVAAGALALALVLGAACGADSGSPASAPAQEPGTTDVTVALFRYQPGTIEVPAGTTVAWLNQDAILHTVTAGVPGRPTGGFDQELADKGARASVTFDRPGTFPYFCTRHPEAMRGEVKVV